MKLIVCFIFLIQSPLFSQDYFYKVNKVETNSSYYQCLHYHQRIFNITSNICQFRECGTVSEVDLFGNIKWSIELPNTDVAPGSSCIYKDTLYISGNYSPGDGITALHKISLDGVLQQSYLYSDALIKLNRTLILNLSQFKDKFIVSGQGFNGEQSKGIIISINVESMNLDTIIIDSSFESTILIDHFIGPDSLLTCFYHQVNKFWPDQVRRIIKYDDDFNQVWSYTSDTLGVNRTFPYGTVLRDGRLAFVDFKPLQNSGLNSLRCLDTITKTNDWMFSYQNVQSWSRNLYTVKQLKNGDIICTGKYTTKASDPRINGSPYMMRIDSTGKLLWERAYVEIDLDGEDKGGSLWDVIELDNGDLMAVGFVTNNRKWDPLIIRTDHRGCMDDGTTNCPSVRIIDLMSGSEDVIVGDKTIKIYPNPTDQQSFTIEMVDFDINTQYQCTVLDIFGQVVSQRNLSQSKQDISLQNTVAGIYIVKISNFNKIVHVEKLIVK